MTSSVAPGDLAAWLRDELAGSDGARTVVLAGHYAIFSGGGSAVDFLADGAPPSAAAEMLAFTKETWLAACDAVAAHRESGARLLVLVDDIMFVRPVAGDLRARERLADALAKRYLDATPTLPPFHSNALAACGLTDDQVFKRAAERWTFSERELRVAHVRRMKDLLRSGSAGTLLAANVDVSEISVMLDGHGTHRLVHAGHTNCAGGYLELLAALHGNGVRRLVSLVPARCLGPITVGTALARPLLTLSGLAVVNVAVPDPASGLPAAVVRALPS
jgi:hypothetical protein